jgi:hypothetical protein
MQERTKVREPLKSFHLPSFLSTPLDFLSSFLPPYKFPLHLVGKGQGEGASFKSFHLPSLFSTPLERARVRGILFSPLAGENKSEGCS